MNKLAEIGAALIGGAYHHVEAIHGGDLSAIVRIELSAPTHEPCARSQGDGGAGLAAPRLIGSALACSSFRAVARERPP